MSASNFKQARPVIKVNVGSRTNILLRLQIVETNFQCTWMFIQVGEFMGAWQFSNSICISYTSVSHCRESHNHGKGSKRVKLFHELNPKAAPTTVEIYKIHLVAFFCNPLIFFFFFFFILAFLFFLPFFQLFMLEYYSTVYTIH